jgi:ligand-binding sensor domain-containing protein
MMKSGRILPLFLAVAVLACGCSRGKARVRAVKYFGAEVTSLVVLGNDVWLGTRTDGIIRISPDLKAPVFYGEKAGLSGGLKDVRGIAPLSEDELLLATNGGVALFSVSQGKVARTWTAKNGLGNDVVRTVLVSRGRVWAGTIQGASRLDTDRKRWKNFRSDKGLSQNHVYRMVDDGKILWASCMGGGLVWYDSPREIWRPVKQERGLGNRFIYAMCGVPGALWLGTAGGVNKYSTEDNAWDSSVCADGYTDYCVYAIQSAGDRIWFGTGYGLCRRDTKTGTQVDYTEADGLPNDEIVALSLNDGLLRVATKNGLAEIKTQ